MPFILTLLCIFALSAFIPHALAASTLKHKGKKFILIVLGIVAGKSTIPNAPYDCAYRSRRMKKSEDENENPPPPTTVPANWA
ncbi:hypothetical protein EYR40_009914 [Pleurotus pulmonarius]|nr:hypothetical protein EYR40_009914 [Pleurotus pulmonarius]